MRQFIAPAKMLGLQLRHPQVSSDLSLLRPAGAGTVRLIIALV
jgi:hypothetical protein